MFRAWSGPPKFAPSSDKRQGFRLHFLVGHFHQGFEIHNIGSVVSDQAVQGRMFSPLVGLPEHDRIVTIHAVDLQVTDKAKVFLYFF